MHRNKNAASKEDSVTWHAVKEVNSPARAKRSRNNTFFLEKKKVLHDSHLCCFLSSCKDLPPCCSPCPAAYWRWDRVQCLCVHEVLSLVRSRNGRTKYCFCCFFFLKKTHIHILVLCWCTTTLQSIRTLAAWRCIFSRKSKSHAHAQNTHASMPPDAHF